MTGQNRAADDITASDSIVDTYLAAYRETREADATERDAVAAALTAVFRRRTELDEARLADMARVRLEDDIAWFAIRSSAMEEVRRAVRELVTVRRTRKETRP
ncbi:hypothetical protein [Melissospora conviva]|uniref:hypothetical protein n=1 Tax=Melissospora conviva TaxID=3388432 RepID=UPI003C2459BD